MCHQGSTELCIKCADTLRKRSYRLRNCLPNCHRRCHPHHDIEPTVHNRSVHGASWLSDACVQAGHAGHEERSSGLQSGFASGDQRHPLGLCIVAFAGQSRTGQHDSVGHQKCSVCHRVIGHIATMQRTIARSFQYAPQR